MNRSQGKINLINFEINIIILTILLYLFRATVPFLKFPFILLFLSLTLYSILKYRTQILSTFKMFFINFYLIIFLALILIISFFLSNKLYLIIFKDIINAIILTSLFFLLTLYIRSKSDLDFFFIKI